MDADGFDVCRLPCAGAVVLAFGGTLAADVDVVVSADSQMAEAESGVGDGVDGTAFGCCERRAALYHLVAAEIVGVGCAPGEAGGGVGGVEGDDDAVDIGACRRFTAKAELDLGQE